MSNLENSEIIKNKVISSLIWKFLERGSVQGIQFVLSIILARLVTLSDYGIIAILLIFIQIANIYSETFLKQLWKPKLLVRQKLFCMEIVI